MTGCAQVLGFTSLKGSWVGLCPGLSLAGAAGFSQDTDALIPRLGTGPSVQILHPPAQSLGVTHLCAAGRPGNWLRQPVEIPCVCWAWTQERRGVSRAPVWGPNPSRCARETAPADRPFWGLTNP